MNDATASAAAAPPAPGQRLRLERERRGLSLQKAADEMHLDGWVIEALESDDYQRIGPAVFAKGHLKKYADILGLPVAEFLDGFDARRARAAGLQTPPDDAAEHEVVASPGMRMATAAFVVLVAGLAAGLWWWKPWHPRADSSSLSGSVAPPSVPEAAAAVSVPAEPASADAVATATATATAMTTAEVVPPAVATPPSQPVVAPTHAASVSGAGSGRARLRLSFSAESRVEIRDASGKLLFGGIGPANSVKQLAGVAPLHVYLSDAGGVQLEINDRAVAIGAKFLSGNVARFDAGADGVLRRDAAAVGEQRPRG